MFTPEDIQWLRQRVDLNRPPLDVSKLPDATAFIAYRKKHRKAQDAVTIAIAKRT